MPPMQFRFVPENEPTQPTLRVRLVGVKTGEPALEVDRVDGGDNCSTAELVTLRTDGTLRIETTRSATFLQDILGPDACASGKTLNTSSRITSPRIANLDEVLESHGVWDKVRVAMQGYLGCPSRKSIIENAARMVRENMPVVLDNADTRPAKK